jgi:phosphonate transport system ATP-binding protein
MSTLLEVQDLSKIYNNGTYAVRNVSFKVEKGEFLGVIGLSGSGKSSMLRCLNRLVEPTSGKILFQGKNIVELSSHELKQSRQKIGMVFQHFNLIPRHSVLRNVLSGKLGRLPTLSSCLGVFDPTDEKRALECLEIVGLREKAQTRADQLSGGQQQRVAIARSLMQDPDLLLADEPVASLDPATSHTVMNYLERANKEFGKTIICNLHFLSLVRQYTTRVIAMKGGEKIFEGSSKDIDDAWFKRIYGEDAQEVQIK